MEAKLKTSFKDEIGRQLQTRPFATVVELLLVFGVTWGLIWLLLPLAEGNQLLRQLIVWFANVVMMALVWMGQRYRNLKLADLGLSYWPGTWKQYVRTFLLSVLVFVLAVAAFILGAIIMNALGVTQAQADMANYDYFKNNPALFILSLIGVYFVSSFGEELVYRAFLMDRIQRLTATVKYQKVIAVLASALFFGLAHYSWGFVGVVQTSFMGLVLAIFYVRLKYKLLILILAHIYMDTLLFASIYFG